MAASASYDSAGWGAGATAAAVTSWKVAAASGSGFVLRARGVVSASTVGFNAAGVRDVFGAAAGRLGLGAAGGRPEPGAASARGALSAAVWRAGLAAARGAA